MPPSDFLPPRRSSDFSSVPVPALPTKSVTIRYHTALCSIACEEAQCFLACCIRWGDAMQMLSISEADNPRSDGPRARRSNLLDVLARTVALAATHISNAQMGRDEGVLLWAHAANLSPTAAATALHTVPKVTQQRLSWRFPSTSVTHRPPPRPSKSLASPRSRRLRAVTKTLPSCFARPAPVTSCAPLRPPTPPSTTRSAANFGWHWLESPLGWLVARLRRPPPVLPMPMEPHPGRGGLAGRRQRLERLGMGMGPWMPPLHLRLCASQPPAAPNSRECAGSPPPQPSKQRSDLPGVDVRWPTSRTKDVGKVCSSMPSRCKAPAAWAPEACCTARCAKHADGQCLRGPDFLVLRQDSAKHGSDSWRSGRSVRQLDQTQDENLHPRPGTPTPRGGRAWALGLQG